MSLSESNARAEYTVDLEGGLTSARTQYAAGAEVTVYFDLIATDTDYTFAIDPEDVKLTQGYDSTRGYVITFVMPAHDVTLSVISRNTMVNQQNNRWFK